MTDYAHVVNGEVVYTGPLPDVGTISGTEDIPKRDAFDVPLRDDEGQIIYVKEIVEKPVSNFHSLDPAILTANGWLPLVDNPVNYDPSTQTRTLIGYAIGPAEVEANWDISYLPPTLTTDLGQIPPDGLTAATVTYHNPNPSSPQTVVFSINGVTHSAALVKGEASVQVASQTKGDIVQVTVADAQKPTVYLAPAISIHVTGGLV